ncbi:MAG: type II toxin-antitoxin system RelE/ParE family toxin [Bacteroidaceae bacterium]|nr:type II toxin-antitoxin system RelE/ParE family toxin [Bacteroidaceae bacterium]
MNCKVVSYEPFDKEVKRLSKRYRSLKQDLMGLVKELLENPSMGTDLGNGFRKIRLAVTSKGKGKRGGARVITLNLILSADEMEIGLFYIYDKSERETITDAELKALRQKSETN